MKKIQKSSINILRNSQKKCKNKEQYNIVLVWILSVDWLDLSRGFVITKSVTFSELLSGPIFQFPLP